ncbi:MAG TPA: sigma-70 family RNA polymerase sigma factor [Chloroflexia bacterium]|nr:sigma-70 family RNA polymerase sigma factor [Chloroflexia bacterium]
MNEPDLISRARTGDEAAWEMLVREHQEPIFRLAYLLLGDSHEAEDVAQDTFIRAFRALHTFDIARSMRPWLLTIASNLARNKMRSLSRYLAALRRNARLEPAVADPAVSPGERSAQQWEANTLWQAVRRLKTHEQEVVYMRYFLELSEVEMASALQVAPGTIKSRLHRAIAQLRTLVDSDFPALREERQA